MSIPGESHLDKQNPTTMNRKSFQIKHLSLTSKAQKLPTELSRLTAQVQGQGAWVLMAQRSIWGEPRAACPGCQPSQHRPAHRVTTQPSPPPLTGENRPYATWDLNCKGPLQSRPNPLDHIWNVQLVGLLEPRCNGSPLRPTAGRGFWAPSPCQHFHGWTCPARNMPGQHWHSVQTKCSKFLARWRHKRGNCWSLLLLIASCWPWLLPW